MGSPDPVKEALEKAAARAARVAVLDAAGQEPSPSDLRPPCTRLCTWQVVHLETTLVTIDFNQQNAKDIDQGQVIISLKGLVEMVLRGGGHGFRSCNPGPVRYQKGPS